MRALKALGLHAITQDEAGALAWAMPQAPVEPGRQEEIPLLDRMVPRPCEPKRGGCQRRSA